MSIKNNKWISLVICVVFVGCFIGVASGEEKKPENQGPPPALIEVQEIHAGQVEPRVEMVGTVYYTRKATVATEVDGLVREVAFEEGKRVRKGDILIRLHDDILDTRIAETRANLEQAQIEADLAAKDLERMKKLFEDRTIAESMYDTHLFRNKGAQKKSDAFAAALDRLVLEKKKKEIVAPFSGIVLDKMTEEGEWLNVGGSVGVLADDSMVDVVIAVSEGMLAWLTPGRKISVTCNSRDYVGRFVSYVPEGDIATRTFAAKIRLAGNTSLVEGMEARALMPAGPISDGLLVDRDAVVTKQGQNVIFTVVDSMAKMIPVTVTGYSGMDSGISGSGLSAGMVVVVKGNERLRGGQPVRFAPGK